MIIYNNLVSKKNQTEYADGAVNAMFKKRYDLIPNLAATVKQYMRHERELLEKLAALRSGNIPAGDPDRMREWEQSYQDAMKSFRLTVENYPDLKAGQQFLNLQASLNECEAQLAAARRTSNAAVTAYNNALEMFPSNIVASFMKYQRKNVTEASTQERQNPNVGDLFQ
jgi:LemA protein